MHDQIECARAFAGLLFGSSICVVSLIFVLGLTGCSTMHFPGKHPKNQFSSFQLTNGPSGPVTTSVLQQQVMRFADTYAATIAQASDDIALGTTNAEIREMMLRWKLQQATAAYNNATGPNPPVNALDMLVLTSMAQEVVEDYGIAHYGDKLKPLLDAQKNMQSNAWSMATSVLSPLQEKELRDLIHEWRVKYPHQVEIGPIRFQELAAALGKVPTEQNAAPESIFSLLYLNPLAQLDPTTAAVVGIHELGERTVYYIQRMPTLLNWQTQLLLYQLEGEPTALQMETDFHQISLAAATLGNSKQLNQIITDQRQAAIQQLLDGLQNKSTGLLQQIDEMSQRMTDNANRAAHHVFVMEVELIFILLAGSVAAGLLYRVLANKITNDGHKRIKADDG